MPRPPGPGRVLGAHSSADTKNSRPCLVLGAHNSADTNDSRPCLVFNVAGIYTPLAYTSQTIASSSRPLLIIEVPHLFHLVVRGLGFGLRRRSKARRQEGGRRAGEERERVSGCSTVLQQ